MHGCTRDVANYVAASGVPTTGPAAELLSHDCDRSSSSSRGSMPYARCALCQAANSFHLL
jgi:hypothetical protein